ncbi:hypothetical protein [Pelosinus sp. IPA-1]|uniref:hypothetical protein n=1 Tax=Pelosinus sp. IPA-1 TaxID=3029569 RepID=UPI0024361E5E|nr:hypothetical protein [Pelosinus sp. IPA-1]GMA99535.1 hypothetical protein PIPA1_23350 [Pelosinus sp. IPA-1]
MKFNIEGLVNTDDWMFLQRLMEVESINVDVAENGEYIPAISLGGGEDHAYLINCPITKIDGDEYPQIKLISDIKHKYKWEKVVNGKAKKITIVRDEVTWEIGGDTWIVNQDSGIKIYFDNIQVLIMAIDSIGGLIKYLVADSVPIEVSKEKLQNYWSFKTDALVMSRRKEIDIFDI